MQLKTNMSERIGRIVVAYIPEWGVIRVVHGVTGECLREDEVGRVNEQGWKAIVMKYTKMMEA